MAQDAHLSFRTDKANSHHSTATIHVSKEYVTSLYNYILQFKQNQVLTQGFLKGATPRAYIEYTFKNSIIEHLKDLLFSHCVINYLYSSITKNRIPLAGEPVLIDVTVDLEQGATFNFEFNHCIPPIKSDWKRLSFKVPTRKNYKDLDKQVEHFLEEETERETKSGGDTICQGDWIRFDMFLVDYDGTELLPGYSDHVWLRLGDEIVDRNAFELFHGKKVGETFMSVNDLLQEYINNTTDISYAFKIHIRDRVPHHYFSVEHFKKHFKLKGMREMQAKLIEVFSYRHDISQRRETVEAAFKLLINQYCFSAPENLTSRQKELVLRIMQSNPDYHVYKTQPDFKNKVHMLAEKQVKEHIVVDYLAYDERLQATDEDIITYLNLTKRPRTKEFIYFDIPSFKGKGHETPVPGELIRYCCLHEKTLNYLINHLSKRT